MEHDSILLSVSKYIGLPMDYPVFDEDLIKTINTSLFYLYQLGVGLPDSPFFIKTYNETWTDFLGENRKYFECVKDYIYIRTKIIFDPPANGVLMEALKEEMRELEWRITVMVDELNSKK